MKTRSYFLLWSVIILTISLTSCTKEEEASSACCACLKPATQSGRNTMSMMINGKPWSNCNPKNTNYTTVGVYWDQYTFRITGYKYFEYTGANEHLVIEPRAPFIGEYKGNERYLIRLFFRDSPIYNSGEFANDTSKPLNLFITKYDETNRIISGKFDCWMIENDGGVDTATLHITEGRFDTRF